MADSLPVPSPEEDDSEQRLQKWLANVRTLHWSPSDYVKLGLGRHVIGQTEAVQAMATLLRQHVKRLQAAIEDGTWNTGRAQTRELRPTLLIGGSGCGKTLLASHVAQLAGLPHACHDMTALTAQGWVGMSTSDLVSGLLLRSGGQFAQRVYEKCSSLSVSQSCVSESSQHQTAHGDVDEGFAGLGPGFVVFAQSSVAAQPGQGALDHPAAR